ncbi:MAG: ABC-type transport auxiliary lipoprotein family protein [Calditrichales bacterium]|nr:ABC-type transport auxiliary lipoprotein family protein [Calditrichales bacterium]
MFKLFKILTVFMITILLFSCSKERALKKYFILEYSTEAKETLFDTLNIATLPYIVQVNLFTICKAYDQNRIAVRSKSNEINYYFYNNWAQNPASAIRYFIWKQLKEADLFQICEMRLLDIQPQYQISGVVDQIERTDMENNFSAHLKMTIEFSDISSGKVLVKHSFDHYIPIDESSCMNTFAFKISQILARETNALAVKIYNNFKK